MLDNAQFAVLAGISAGTILAYVAKYAAQSASIKLKHFEPKEFGFWWPLMNPKLLYALDAFREKLGHPIMISPAHGALGRYMGKEEGSQHNVTKWGQVNAVDVMPKGVYLDEAYLVAKNLNKFTGIGVYPDWLPLPGLHLDVRSDRTPMNPATWSGLKTANGQKYFAVEEAFT